MDTPLPVPPHEYIDHLWRSYQEELITAEDMRDMQAVFLASMAPIPLPECGPNKCRRCWVKRRHIQRLCDNCWRYERIILAKAPSEEHRRAMVRGWR